MTRLDQLRDLRVKIDRQIAAEVRRLETEAVRRLETEAKVRRARLADTERAGWAVCGTDGGYYRHRRTLSEPACSDCKRAHTRAESERAERRAAREVAS